MSPSTCQGSDTFTTPEPRRQKVNRNRRLRRKAIAASRLLIHEWLSLWLRAAESMNKDDDDMRIVEEEENI